MKKASLQRVLCFALCVLMIISVCGCGSSRKNSTNGRAANKNSAYSNDEIKDLNGYTFVIASPFLHDEPDLSSVTDAERIFYAAREKVEKQFNCKIKIENVWPEISTVRSKILAGDKIGDIIDYQVNLMLQSAHAGYIVPFDSIDGIDISDYRWISGYTSLATYGGKHYGLNFMRPVEARACVVYNKDILKSSGINDNLADLVRKNQWTFDKFEEFAKACTKVVNGKVETYGVYTALPQMFGTSLISANGGSIVSIENGKAVGTYTDSKVINALNFLNKLANEDKVLRVFESNSLSETEDAVKFGTYFVNGECAFLFCESWLVNQNIKPNAGDMKYGVVPLPMGPDASDYCSPSQHARVFCLSSTNTDLDKTVPVFNALAKEIAGDEENQDWWSYDVQKNYFDDNDKDSTEMYLKCIDKSTVDLAIGVNDLYEDFCQKVITEAIYENKGTPASKIDSINGIYQNSIDAVYN